MKPIEEIYRVRLRMLAAEVGTQRALADRIQKSPAQISQWLNASLDSKSGKPRAMDRTTAREIERLFPKPLGWMDQQIDETDSANEVDLSTHPDLVAVRRVKLKLQGGINGFGVEPENSDGVPIFFRKEWLKNRGFRSSNLLALKVTGQSMEPTLFEGDMVVVNTADQEPKDGKVFAVNYEGEAVIKRITRDGGSWWLSSDNPDKRRFPTKEVVDKNALIIGMIVHRQSEFL